MNIVYLIGNGFDLNLDLKTSYNHFYDYYISLPTENDSKVISDFKKELWSESDKWSYLEYQLGKYLKKLNADEAVLLHDHLIEQLSKYIASEEEKYSFDDKQKNIFREHLNNPFKKLLPEEISELNKYKSQMNNSSPYIRIITFNYTRIIDNFGVDSSAIEHIHGFTDERMILGVNDFSQIENTELQKNTDVTDRFIKPACNSTYRLGHEQKCQQWITQAQLICLFGLSFGDTDKNWWIEVGTALQRGCKVIIFEHNPKKTFNKNQGPALIAAEDKVKDYFLSKTNLDKDSMNSAKKNIYVAYNTDMFKLNAK